MHKSGGKAVPKNKARQERSSLPSPSGGKIEGTKDGSAIFGVACQTACDLQNGTARNQGVNVAGRNFRHIPLYCAGMATPSSFNPTMQQGKVASTVSAGTCALSRIVRFEVSPVHDLEQGTNNHSANPRCEAVCAWFEVVVRCLGIPNCDSGMVLDIHEIDALVRSRLPDLLRASLTAGDTSPGAVLQAFAESLTCDDPAIESITLSLNPRRSVTLRTTTMHDILLTNQYQFAASHRLYNPSLDQAKNEALFGKCCRESGHGHNYWVEVDVVAPLDGPFAQATMDAIVQQSVIDRFDHRNLNTDCAEFESVLTTVEHITIICHGLLVDPIAEAGGTLRQVRVWETQRTCASYPVEPTA